LGFWGRGTGGVGVWGLGVGEVAVGVGLLRLPPP
jgi:hypothetical protein